MWFGGIGNYIKARSETHADVGDKANDVHPRRRRGRAARRWWARAPILASPRRAASRLRATAGASIPTRSTTRAGVDTSDHEVNIKILLADAIRSGALKADKRDKLLESMTDEVGDLVLKNNYDQTGAISIAQASAVNDLDSHERFIQRLESEGKLSRARRRPAAHRRIRGVARGEAGPDAAGTGQAASPIRRSICSTRSSPPTRRTIRRSPSR